MRPWDNLSMTTTSATTQRQDPRTDSEKIADLQAAVEFLATRCKTYQYALGGLLQRHEGDPWAEHVSKQLYPILHEVEADGYEARSAPAMPWWRSIPGDAALGTSAPRADGRR